MAFPTHIVSAGGIVEDGKGNILLVKAHDDGWVYPGGITEIGENLIDGVIREIKEESGIDDGWPRRTFWISLPCPHPLTV